MVTSPNFAQIGYRRRDIAIYGASGRFCNNDLPLLCNDLSCFMSVRSCLENIVERLPGETELLFLLVSTF